MSLKLKKSSFNQFSTLNRSDEFRCSSSGQCIDASLICNQVRDCPGGEDEAQICKARYCPKKSTFRCSYGRCIAKEAICDNFNDCINGEDESDLLCKSLACNGPDCEFFTCPSITSNRLKVSCEFDGKNVTCDKDIKPGTIAKYACREFFQPATNFHKFNDEAACQRNGKWSQEVLKCEPKCGYLRTAIPLIVNGLATDNIVPWHATLFMKKGDDFVFACGGTLITESVVLSAGHCFTGVTEKDVKIAIGKRRSVFAISSDEIFAAVFDIVRIIRHPLYLDKVGNYGSDIALVKLNASVEMSDDIHPACIDWNLDDITSQLSNSHVGIITGMGITENDTNSDLLRLAKLPVVANEECVRQEPKDFQKFVTFTTFCAGWGNGSMSPCNGDSGGGFLFLSRDLKTWKVQGVVSLSPRKKSTFFCDPFKYTVFTKVGLYVKWIKFVLDSIHDSHPGDYEPIL